MFQFTFLELSYVSFQIKGLGTALKILFSKPFQLKQIADYVTRNELVALINGFGR